jgi:hypothetical protein
MFDVFVTRIRLVQVWWCLYWCLCMCCLAGVLPRAFAGSLLAGRQV